MGIRRNEIPDVFPAAMEREKLAILVRAEAMATCDANPKSAMVELAGKMPSFVAESSRNTGESNRGKDFNPRTGHVQIIFLHKLAHHPLGAGAEPSTCGREVGDGSPAVGGSRSVGRRFTISEIFHGPVSIHRPRREPKHL